MLASSFVWSGKKYSPKEVIDRRGKDSLPLVVKVVQVPEKYEKSCPEMAANTVFWVYEVGKVERVAMKTIDNTNFISLPVDSPIKFKQVFTHERGPSISLKNLLQGKADPELKIEISGNEGNRLSSAPDRNDPIRYGHLQVVGTYVDTVLFGQAILKGDETLKTCKQSISVNCPLTFDIATGLLRKNQDEFNKLKDTLKQSQSTKTSSNEAELPPDVVLLSNASKFRPDFQLSQHICRLYNSATSTDKMALPSTEGVEYMTFVKGALSQLKKNSKQDNIPLVDKKAAKPPSKKSTVVPPAVNVSVVAPIVAIYDDAISSEPVLPEAGSNKKKTASDFTSAREQFTNKKTTSEQQLTASAPKTSSTRELSSQQIGSNAYLNQAESSAIRSTNTNYEFYIPGTESNLNNRDSALSVSQPMLIKLNTGDYLNERKPQLALPENKSGNLPSKPVSLQKTESLEIYEQVAYEVLTTSVDIRPPPTPNVRSKRKSMPLPPAPSDKTPKEKKKNRISLFKWPFGGKGNGGMKQQSKSIEQNISDDEYDYTEPVDTGIQPSQSLPNINTEGRAQKWKSASEIPKNIKKFSIRDISLCLELLHLGAYVQKFRERNVDGAFLLKLNKKMLVSSFQMQDVEAKILTEFTKKNWRPKE